MEKYHDEEWGVAVRTDAAHFERLSLEVFQAGLSWRTILHKRAAFRKGFSRFSPRKVAAYTERDILRLLADAGIVRHRGKIEATIENASRLLTISTAHGGFSAYLDSLPGNLEELRRILRKEFRFMGPKIAESYLESVGKISPPHERGCWKSKRRTLKKRT
jgi:DNA-3-methyladenine glycosylase I